MNDNTPDEVVDGYSDVQQNEQQGGESRQQGPGSPDPGIEGKLQPLGADERAELEEEIRSGEGEQEHARAVAEHNRGNES